MLLFVVTLALSVSCAYFNTFYNAHNYFRQATRMVSHDTLKMDHEYFDKTIEKTTAIIVKYPQSRYVDDALYMMGVSYFHKGDYPRALEKLDYILYNYTESRFYDDALYYKGLAHFKQGKFNEAVIALKEVLQYKHFRNKAKLILCYAYYASEGYTELIEIAQQMLEERLSKKERRWIFSILGDAQFKQELYVDALVSYNDLLAITRLPNEERELKLNIAETYLQMGEYEKCRDFLEGEFDPEFRSIFADLTAELGDNDGAKEVYLEVAISGFSDVSAQAFFKMAELYRDEDSLELAIAYYDSAVNRAAMNEYGVQAKKMADVLRRINDLMSQVEEPDQAQFLMAEIYYIDFKEAQRASVEYEEVYKQYPESEWAPKALYARFWINHTILQNDSIAQACATLLIQDFQDSEYAVSATTVLGWDRESNNDEPEKLDEQNQP